MFSVDALNVCKLAHLFTHIDMALLELLHKLVLGKGPAHFAILFRAVLPTREDGRGTHRLLFVEYINGHVSDFMVLVASPANYIA